MNCLLCHTPSSLKASGAFECSHCGLVFKNPLLHWNATQDFERYSTHNNNEQDQGYIDFLNCLVDPLVDFLPENFEALDFGCGPGPTLSLLLKEKGGVVENYDPLFFPNLEALKRTYEVVTSSEVVEHFKTPVEDWELLASLVKPNGLLAVKTLLISDKIDYKSWWYKNDPTHVVFYREETLVYLANRFHLEIIFNDNKSVIIFRKK
ncbi:MAG: class I SAM-dependent methyltransferase [Bacteriovorax sp.]|nr:class I SAM-dependent methyltransferase [Bacteriovorax sp.]